MSDEARDTIEQWRQWIGAGKHFHEQDLWKERQAHDKHTKVAWCGMNRRLAIKRI